MHAALLSSARLALPALVLTALAVRPASAAEQVSVSYRCPEWKVSEFEDRDAAKAHVETLRKLNCEVKPEEHAGHVDVRYRCPEWKTIAVKDHDAAHRWQKWLKDAGFETKHAH